MIWVHSYCTKGNKPWKTQANQASWIVTKILQGGKWFEEARLSKEEILEAKAYSIKKTYNKLKEEYRKVPWRRLVCNNQGSPSEYSLCT